MGRPRCCNKKYGECAVIVSIERGRDPRKYSMVAFGGAGPLHASRLAKEIGIPKVIIPFAAGLGSAIDCSKLNLKLICQPRS